MPASSFTVKQLRVTFNLSTNAVFQGTASNTLVLTGLRVSANVRGYGFPSFPEMDLSVYGMKQADMQALSALAFNPLEVVRNTVTLEANAGNGWAQIYAGQICSAFIDYSAAPEVPLRVSARVLFLESLAAAPAVSYTGPTDVATMCNNIAGKVGYSFVNTGVTAQLSNPYCTGTVAEQLRNIALNAGIDCYTDNNQIEICPKGQPRALPSFALTPQSGLVGYPLPDSRGYIHVRALFNPAFRYGAPITISGSDVVIDQKVPKTLNSRADGSWMIGWLSHTLEALKPNGAWFTDMLLYPPGQLPPIQ
jgi:hypothetical protein